MPAADMACEALLSSGIIVSVNTNLKTLHTHTKVSKTFPVNWEGGTFSAEREDNPWGRQVIPSKSPLKSISEGCNETPEVLPAKLLPGQATYSRMVFSESLLSYLLPSPHLCPRTDPLPNSLPSQPSGCGYRVMAGDGQGCQVHLFQGPKLQQDLSPSSL